MVRGLPGRSCLKSINIIKKTSSLTPTLKKLIKFQKFIFSFVMIFLKKNSYLILRSGKFGNLVTSFFHIPHFRSKPETPRSFSLTFSTNSYKKLIKVKFSVIFTYVINLLHIRNSLNDQIMQLEPVK